MFRPAVFLLLAIAFSPAARAQQVTLTDQVKLDVPYRAAARLLPGGRQVLFVERAERTDPRRYTYQLIDVDGANKHTLFESTLDWDDLFSFAIGDGFISPSGRKLAVLTTHNGKPFRNEGGGQVIAVIIDPDGKEIARLPSEYGIITSPLFPDENTVVFCDSTNPDETRENTQTKLQRFDLATGKVTTLRHFEGRFVTCLQLSPDRKRIAGVDASFDREHDVLLKVFVCDSAGEGIVEADPGRMESAYYNDALWFVWSPDSRHVYFAAQGEGTRDARLLRFSPDAAEGQRLTTVPLDDAESAPATNAGQTLTEEQRREVVKLIDQLGAPGFDQRQSAQEKLVAFGKAALPLIEQARDSDDAEVALRAEEIARKIKGEPDPEQAGQRRRQVFVTDAISDDLLSVAVSTATHEGLAVSMATGRVTRIGQPVVILDHDGNAALLVDLQTRTVQTAKLKLTP